MLHNNTFKAVYYKSLLCNMPTMQFIVNKLSVETITYNKCINMNL